MPEEAVQTTAEQQPAADPSPAPIEIPTDPEAYAQWRMNEGRSPEDAKPAKAEGKTPKQEGSAPSDSESSVSETETKKSQEKPQRRSNADDRINEWLGDIKALGLKPNDLKLSREELLERLSPSKPQPKAAPETTEQPAAAPAQAERKPPVKPEFKDYNGDWEAFDAAMEKYREELTDYKVDQALQRDRLQRAIEANQRVWRQKLDEAKARYGDEAGPAIVKVAQQIAGDTKIYEPIKKLLDESEVLPDLLYVMSSKPDDLADFLTEAKERPGLALRRAVLLEHLVKEELASKGSPSNGQPRDDATGQFIAAKPPAKKTTAAPAPPSEVSGHGSPPEDDAVRATRDGDFRTFFAVERRKALARMKGQ